MPQQNNDENQTMRDKQDYKTEISYEAPHFDLLIGDKI
jgi:hypothetical protein